MNIEILSNYMNIDNGGLYPINVTPNVDNSMFEKGNLIIKEHYEKNDSLSYTKETMIIKKVENFNILTLTVSPVIKLEHDNMKNNYVAYINHYQETFSYINNNWKGEDDKSCDNIILIYPNQVVKRTNISEGYLFEENGNVLATPALINDQNYKPTWCNN